MRRNRSELPLLVHKIDTITTAIRVQAGPDAISTALPKQIGLVSLENTVA